jgi:hypothetical protein
MSLRRVISVFRSAAVTALMFDVMMLPSSSTVTASWRILSMIFTEKRLLAM